MKRQYIIAAFIGACLWLIPVLFRAEWDGQWFSQYKIMPCEFTVPIAKLQAPQEQWHWLVFADDLNERGFAAAMSGAAIGVGILMIWDAVRRRWTKKTAPPLGVPLPD
jgi:hypothetical protein